jgi:hypothetical protein
MSDTNLPPGCTVRGLERACGDSENCESCGREAALDADGLCARCADDQG